MRLTKLLFIPVYVALTTGGPIYGLAQVIDYHDLKINEVYPGNEPCEWIELINTSRRTVDAQGIYISDGDNLFKITRPAPIKPGERFLIEAPLPNGKWPNIEKAGCPTWPDAPPQCASWSLNLPDSDDCDWGFKKGSFEAVIILGPQKEPVDFIFKPGISGEYKSFGRYPDGYDIFHLFDEPTKGNENREGKEFARLEPTFYDFISTTWGLILATGGAAGSLITLGTITMFIFRFFRRMRRGTEEAPSNGVRNGEDEASGRTGE